MKHTMQEYKDVISFIFEYTVLSFALILKL